MYKYAIVVIGYNNSDSILRLLNSLNAAEYGNDAEDACRHAEPPGRHVI